MSARCLAILAGPMAEAYQLIPVRMRSPQADVLLLAIGLQESRLRDRDQRESRDGRDLVPGPAMGLWQFERAGGVRGVLMHATTRNYAAALCKSRGVEPVASEVWAEIKRDDVLAAGFARLLLWTLPGALPALGDADGAWQQYVKAWRPGRPHPDSWPALYAEALATVQGRR